MSATRDDKRIGKIAIVYSERKKEGENYAARH
jgi:hypothetical protein